MIKSILRKEYQNKRSALDIKERLYLDDLILLQFQQLNYAGVKNLLTYWPLEKKAEPNSFLCSRYLSFLLPSLETAYPVVQDYGLEAVKVTAETLFQTNQWGITEPKIGELMHPIDIDLVLVPMLICDKGGCRIGYGKGFYDRLLITCREEVTKIGFSYFEPVDKITDTHQFDVPLTYCITPQRIYEF